MGLEHLQLISLLQSPVILLLLLWDIIWKSVGMWKSARHNQLKWFIGIVIFNTVGILPIVYILYFQKGKREKK
jgi:hypothetical protein